MRQAKYNDGWRRTRDLKKYNCQLLSLSISDAHSHGISEKFFLELNCGVSAICGKNGVGKSTILRSIYSHISQHDKFKTRLDDSTFEFVISDGDKKIENREDVIINYIEPSVECNKIIGFLKASENIDDFIEGVEPNGNLGRQENVKTIGEVIGKTYSAIDIYEVEGALTEDYTFPFIKVTLQDGTMYSCLDMGAGEYLCMYLFWYVNWIENNSILLIDEIENCISVYSQEYMIDYLAYISSQNGIWVLLSSHSEAILKKVGIGNTRLISNVNNKGIDVVSPKHERKYFTALGIKSKKKGVFIVEDKFAYFTLNAILNKMASDIAYDFQIISLKAGESDIEKVVKHFNPSKNIDFKFIAVFDADMGTKIKKLVGNAIPVLSLPSSNALNPEEEIWQSLTDYINNIASNLGVDSDDLYQYFELCSSLDHHERFMKLSVLLNVSEEVLFNGVFPVWAQQNTEFINKFVFAIILQSVNLTNKEKCQLAANMHIKDFNFDEKDIDAKTIYFDGKTLLIN